LLEPAEHWKRILSVSKPRYFFYEVTLFSLQIIAAFGFGEQIGAIGAWENGEDLNMIKANDEKSKRIALV
jgi:hypothetical protein